MVQISQKNGGLFHKSPPYVDAWLDALLEVVFYADLRCKSKGKCEVVALGF